MRINVVGTSSCGKTTVSKRLSKILSIPHIEIDALFWGPNWEQSSLEELCAKLRSALKGESWILDGNYTKITPIKWKNVNIVIWLDLSFIRSLLQAIKRAITRIIEREELWPGTGNIERLGDLFSKDSIVLYTIKKHRRVRRKYEEYFKCLYFGDGDSNELMGASQLGMDAVMIRDPNELDPYRLVEVVWDGRKIENFTEIKDLL